MYHIVENLLKESYPDEDFRGCIAGALWGKWSINLAR